MTSLFGDARFLVVRPTLVVMVAAAVAKAKTKTKTKTKHVGETWWYTCRRTPLLSFLWSDRLFSATIQYITDCHLQYLYALQVSGTAICVLVVCFFLILYFVHCIACVATTPRSYPEGLALDKALAGSSAPGKRRSRSVQLLRSEVRVRHGDLGESASMGRAEGMMPARSAEGGAGSVFCPGTQLQVRSTFFSRQMLV